MNDIYKMKGCANRAEYLESLALQYEVDIREVEALAELLGPNEDFDGLVTALQDHAGGY